MAGDQQLLLIDPMRQLRILLRYWWQILGAIAIGVLGTLVASYIATPVYRGSATLLIESQAANVIKIDEVYEPGTGTLVEEHKNTQVEILRSRALAEQVFENLNLAQYPEYESEDGEDSIHDRIKGLMDNIEIEPVLHTALIKIHADAEDPELAAKIANAVVAAYIASDKSARGDVTNEATEWLTQRLAEIKADLERSEKALQGFYDTEELVNVGGARGLVEDETSDNAKKLREARRTSTELENVHKRILEAGNNVDLLQQIPAIQQEPLVQATKRSFLDARGEVGALETRYGRRHPKLIAANARLEEARGAYERQLRIAADGVRSQFQIARTNETSLAGVVEVSRNQIQSLDRKQHEFELLQREVDTNRRLFDTFFERIKEADIAGNLDIGKTRTIELAIAPEKPFKPKRRIWLLTAAVVGSLLAVSGAFLRAFFDDTIKSPADLGGATRLPLLTALPIVSDPGQRSEKLARIEIEDPTAEFSEGVRTLRTRIVLHYSGRDPRSLLVTSSLSGEGKTSVALNLAVAMGRVERVILIDGDLRRPSIGSMLGLPKQSKGVVDALTGAAPLSECIHTFEAGNISVMPSRESKYALELLSSLRFAQLLKELEESYDRIVIDSPPVQPVSDALLLSRTASAVVFLIKANSTPTSLVANSLDRLQEAGAEIVGVVLNQADLRRYSGPAYGYTYLRDERYGTAEA